MLTSFLQSKKVQDSATHPDFPHLVKPAGLDCRPYRECSGCPAAAAHPSYERGRATEAGPLNQRQNLTLLRTLQWLVHRINRDLIEPQGMLPGYLYNARRSLNFSDAQTFKVVSVDGDQITLEYGESGDDARSIAWFPISAPEPEIGIWRLFYAERTVPMPGDEVAFVWPSVLADKARPTIRRIISCTPETRRLTLQLDQTVNSAMWSADSLDPDPTAYYVQIWKQYDREKWQRVVDSDPFYGQIRNRSITAEELTALDEHGRLTLKDSKGRDTAVADYMQPNERAGIPWGTFRVLGLNRDTGEWDDLSAAVWQRTRVEITQKAEPVQYRTTVCLGDTDHDGETPLADLRDPYSAFRIRYIAKVSASEKGARWMAPCQARCKWSFRDHSGSVGNYSAPNGVGVDSGGNHHFCFKRRYPVSEDIRDDNPGSPTYGMIIGRQINYVQPSGIANYPADGRCLQHGVCDQYEPLAPTSAGAVDQDNGVWTVYYSWARWWKQIWHAASVRLSQLMPGLSTHRNIVVEQVGNPSVFSLHGRASLTSEPGMHEMAWFPEEGVLTGEWETYTYTETVGEETVTHTRLREKFGGGSNWDQDYDPSAIDIDDPGTYPGPGWLPRNVDDYTEKRDAIDYQNTVSTGQSYQSPDCSLVYHSERSGYVVERDSGQIRGRGAHQYTHVAPQGARQLTPAVRLDLFDEVQDRGDTVFIRYGPGNRPTFDGMTVGAVIVWRSMLGGPKLSELAPETVPGWGLSTHQVASGVIHSITSLGNGLYEIEIANQPQRWSVVDGPPGGRFDRVIEYRCGGRFVAPPDWTLPRSFHSLDKVVGGQHHKCVAGDSVRITFNQGGINLSDHPMLVVQAKAHAGSQASDFGNQLVIRDFVAGGFWQADAAFLHRATDPVFGDVAQPIAVPSAVITPFAHSAGSSDIWIQPAVPLANGARLRNRRTGEIVIVAAWSMYVEGSPQFGGMATLGASLTNNVEAGDAWDWLTVSLTASPYTPLTPVQGLERPALAAGEYWIDTDANRIFFGHGTAALSPEVNVQYTGELKDITTDDVKIDVGFEVPQFAEFVTDLSYSAVSGKPLTMTRADGSPLTYVAGDPTAKGEYTVFDADGTAAFRLTLHDAGEHLRATWDMQTPLTDPGTVVGITGWNSWVRKRDVIRVIDDTGLLAKAGSNVVGATITAWAGDGYWLPEGKPLQVTPYRADSFQNVPEEAIRRSHGRGMIMIDNSYLEALETTVGPLVCWGAFGDEED